MIKLASFPSLPHQLCYARLTLCNTLGVEDQERGFTTRNYMIHLLGDYGGQVQLLLGLLHVALSHDGGHEEGGRGQEVVGTEGLDHQHVV